MNECEYGRGDDTFHSFCQMSPNNLSDDDIDVHGEDRGVCILEFLNCFTV